MPEFSIMADLQSVNVSILPRSDNAYDLGSSSYRWRDLFLSRNAYIGGKVAGVNNIATEGIGVGAVRKLVKESLLTTTVETTVASYTVDSGADRFIIIYVFFRVITAPTVVTVKVEYTDPAGNPVTWIPVNAETRDVGNYSLIPLAVMCKAGTVINVKFTCGTANQVYASACIMEVG